MSRKKSAKAKLRARNVRRKRAKKTKARKRTRKEKWPPLIIERPVLYLDQAGARGASCYRVQFCNLDGETVVLDIPRTTFSRPSTVADVLLSAHALLPPKREQQIELVKKAMAKRAGTKSTLRVTNRVGWQVGRPCFTYFTKTFGADDLEYNRHNNNYPALGMTAGSLDGWREGLREACEYSDHLIFAAGISASGPLFDILGPSAEPAIYHFQGAAKPEDDDRAFKSSSGKTLSARVAQSLFARCQQQDLFGFSTTMRGLEETCFACNNLTLVLDEEGTVGESGSGEIDPKVLPFRIISGRSKKRSEAFGGGHHKNLSWTVPVISTSERELDPGGKSFRKEGERVRMVAVPFPPTYEGGIFHKVKDPSERTRLAALVEHTIAQNYGVAMPSYLARLVEDRPALILELPGMLGSFISGVGADTDSWERRLASKFGIVAIGAQLLARYGVGPWTEQRAVETGAALYRASRATTVSIPRATGAFISHLDTLMKIPGLFPVVEKGDIVTEQQKVELIGIRRTIGGEQVIALPYTRFENLVRPSAVADRALLALADQGRLVTGADGNLRRQLQITGLGRERQRYVCIRMRPAT